MLTTGAAGLVTMRCVVCRLPQQKAVARQSQHAAQVRHGQHLRGRPR